MPPEEIAENGRVSDKDVQEVRDKLIYLEGFMRASKLWALFVLALFIGWLGFTSYVEIPRAVEEHFEGEAKDQVDAAVSEIRASGSLATSSANLARANVAEAEALLREARDLLDRVRPIAEDLDDGSDDNVVEPTPPDPGSGPVTTPTEPPVRQNAEIVLFESMWAKAGYFLLIEENLRLNVDSVDASTVDIRISAADSVNIASRTLGVGESLEFQNNSRTYSVQLARIGGAGFNRATRAGFFRVVTR